MSKVSEFRQFAQTVRSDRSLRQVVQTGPSDSSFNNPYLSFDGSMRTFVPSEEANFAFISMYRMTLKN